MRPQQWYQRWFGTEYKRLYPHRDADQARLQAESLLAAVREDDRSSPVRDALDVGCGAGRHLEALRRAGLRVAGVDLSPVLLRDARTGGHAVARADMRRLPFADSSFDLVASFFTSFGYFATPAEDAIVLAEFARVVRPGGAVFLDLPNPDVVRRDLVPAETTVSGDFRAEVTRTVEDDVVIKRIRLSDERGGAGEVFEERVRLYDRATLEPVLERLGLAVVATRGDERGAPFDPAVSPRMSLVLRAAGGRA